MALAVGASWDARKAQEVLKIVDTKHRGGTPTCVAIGKKSQRCSRVWNMADERVATSILERLSYFASNEIELRVELKRLAPYCLCQRNHRNDAKICEVVEKWLGLVHAEIAAQSAENTTLEDHLDQDTLAERLANVQIHASDVHIMNRIDFGSLPTSLTPIRNSSGANIATPSTSNTVTTDVFSPAEPSTAVFTPPTPERDLNPTFIHASPDSSADEITDCELESPSRDRAARRQKPRRQTIGTARPLRTMGMSMSLHGLSINMEVTSHDEFFPDTHPGPQAEHRRGAEQERSVEGADAYENASLAAHIPATINCDTPTEDVMQIDDDATASSWVDEISPSTEMQVTLRDETHFGPGKDHAQAQPHLLDISFLVLFAGSLVTSGVAVYTLVSALQTPAIKKFLRERRWIQWRAGFGALQRG